MQLCFEGHGEARGEVTVTSGVTTDVKVNLSGIRRSLHLGTQVRCELHWAVLDEAGAWSAPQQQPLNSRAVDPVASRIECQFSAVLSFVSAQSPRRIAFVVWVQADGVEHWLKSSGGSDFVIPVEELVTLTSSRLEVLSDSPGGWLVADRPKVWPPLSEALLYASASPVANAGRRHAPVPSVKTGTQHLEKQGRVEWHVVTAGKVVTVLLEAWVPLPEDARIFMHFGCLYGNEWETPRERLAGVTLFDDGRASRTQLEGQARALLQFSSKEAPRAIGFVLFVTSSSGELWLKADGGSDFSVEICKRDVVDVGTEVARTFCDAETRYAHWSHFQRLCLVKDLLSQRASLRPDEAAWIACDLCLANTKKLEWYRHRGYQPKDMAHCQESVGGIMANAIRSSKEPVVRTLLRLAARACPRGSSSGGDAIRHGILDILRRHGIREGHRPGIECKFLEQWHQKLHTNSAPDDIAICEGYLAFLRSGHAGDFFRVVWEMAGITREDLSKMAQSGFQDHTKTGARGLNVDPVHLPQLHNDMQRYLGLLRHVHGGTDLFALCESCKGQYPDHGAECLAFQVFHERGSVSVVEKIVELRRRLEPCTWARDIMMLDVALEDELRLAVERRDMAKLSADEVCGLMAHLLKDLCLSRHGDSLKHGVDLFLRLSEGDHGFVERWSSPWCRLMTAACERLSLVCAGLADLVAELLQSCATSLILAGEQPGAVFSPDTAALASFGEEAARCLTERLVAQCLRVLQPELRRAAGLGPWDVVSHGGTAVGAVQVMSALPAALAQGQAPCVALTDTLTGWEDIPAGIVAVLLPAAHAVDALSHVAIRARNQHVLLASCDDDAILTELRGQSGNTLRLELTANGDITWTQAEVGAFERTTSIARPPTHPTVTNVPKSREWVLSSSHFGERRGSVGGKSLHLSELQAASQEFQVPVSVTVPFGIFESVLADAFNEGVRTELSELLEEENWAAVRTLLVDELSVPPELGIALLQKLALANAPIPDGVYWERALVGVWASKWSDRAVSSRRQTGLPDSSLSVAVLVQPLTCARYAFVIHTQSPLPGARSGEALIEVVVGLGESLVSNSPGRALSASVGAGMPVVVHTFPSKPDGVFAPEGGTHIFRSDSNGEDLDGFAGAGLYDSITVIDCPKRAVCYTSEPLLFDTTFRENLLRRLFDLGRSVESHFYGPQDIEGAVDIEQNLIVLQSRPQV